MVTRMTHETPFFRREDVFTLTESPRLYSFRFLPKLFLPVFQARQVIT